MKWTETLLNWYDENQRDFPWRKSRNPIMFGFPEIILQQTRVEQGLPITTLLYLTSQQFLI